MREERAIARRAYSRLTDCCQAHAAALFDDMRREVCESVAHGRVVRPKDAHERRKT